MRSTSLHIAQTYAGRPADAQASIERAIARLRGLVRLDPGNADWPAHWPCAARPSAKAGPA